MARKAAIAKNKTNIPRISLASSSGLGCIAVASALSMNYGINIGGKGPLTMKAAITFEENAIAFNKARGKIMAPQPTKESGNPGNLMKICARHFLDPMQRTLKRRGNLLEKGHSLPICVYRVQHSHA